MKRQIILLALAISSCTKPQLPAYDAADIIPTYGTENITLTKNNGATLLSGVYSSFNPWKDDTLKVYPYPNTEAPVVVESADSSKMIPSLIDANTIILDVLAPGRSSLTITSEGFSKDWIITVERKLLYDLKYDPSTDQLTLDFTQNPSYPVEEDFWKVMTADLHITLIWSYKVGYGSNFMNTRYPRTTVIQGEFPVSCAIFLESLEQEYKKIKQLYDEEMATEYAKDPNHAWSSWSGIELKVIIRNSEKYMTLSNSKGSDSVYGYNLGFKFSHSLKSK